VKRPVIEIEKKPIDWFMDIVGIIFILLIIGYPLVNYSSLPDQIPTHFDASGQPDAFGSKSKLWGLPAIATICFIGLFILNFFPHIFNYPTEINESNAESMYRNATRMIRVLNLVIAVSFFYISFRSINTAMGVYSGLGSYFLPIFITATLLPVILFMIWSFRNNK
jgi:uncharacterized membrane protein